MELIRLLFIVLLSFLLIYSTIVDIIARTVSNKIVLAIIIFSFTLAIMRHDLIKMVIISAVIFSILLLFWYLGWLGGGDVKLISAIVLGLAPEQVLAFILAVSLCGGILAIVYGICKKLVGPPPKLLPVDRFARIVRIEWWRIHRGVSIPYVCAIFAGYLFSVF